ncbi:DUF1559 family PulG-like putative transporter [Aeoliella mucimassa]|uniref:DUF1559 domain-containing protein n=1 Tax=Aeoliella mucimassa TaxID=2527972 RepID=A0A518AVL9_9BACT|nr:DUF1559 domain-containing protein [Aeoliella mucimassa]QDU58787.1 hypothetical protein Pan181_50270 [Aeoliella mucimassa]
MMYKRTILTGVLILLTAVAQAESDQQARVAGAIGQLAGDDTLAVAVVEIDGRWVSGVQKEVASRVGPEANQLVNSPAYAMGLGFVESFRSAGAKELVIVLGTSDLHPTAGPIAAITTGSPKEAEAVLGLTKSLLPMLGREAQELTLHQLDSLVLVGQAASIESYAVRTDGNAELGKRVADLLGDGDADTAPVAGLVIDPGKDPRRVIRELWPRMPKPFDKVTGELLADQLQSIQVRATCPPDWNVQLRLDTHSEAAAEVCEQALVDGLSLALEQAAGEQVPAELKTLVAHAAKILAPQRDGTAITVTVNSSDEQVAKLMSEVLMPAVESAQASAKRSQQMNQFKQMSLGMLNFESANNYLPAAGALTDRDGKPLLSWRVAILPYLSDGESMGLYNRFHLDEPWDSPHNLQLVKQMPDVYSDQLHPQLAAEGLTTFQVPVQANSIFPPKPEGELVEREYNSQKCYFAPGTTFRQVLDGTSNTLLVVQMPPEQAVPWTKPADWEVDLAKVVEQFRGNPDRGQVVAAFCDGHVEILPTDDPLLPKNLPILVQMSDGKVIER